MVPHRKSLTDHFERIYVLTILLSVPILHYFIPLKLAFVNFYFLPVIAAGYFVGMRFSILGALFCVLVVLLFTILFPNQFAVPSSPEYLISYLLADEQKHDKLLDDLALIKKRMYP